LKGARVLVTGAGGFIGSVVARRLVESGAQVSVMLRRDGPYDRLDGLKGRVSVVRGDLDDAASLAAAMKTASPEYVFHLAKDREASSFEKEAQASFRLGAALKAAAPGLKRLVRTAHAERGGFSRGADAAVAQALKARYGLPVVTLDLFLVYGPGMEKRDLTPAFVAAARTGTIAEPPGGGRKDFVFVEDVARAYLLAATAPGVEGASFQIGTGTAVGQGQGEPADPREAKKRLGWAPEVRLADGLAMTLQWLGDER
jgi:dTDP-glucose 4,6-dehydratase